MNRAVVIGFMAMFVISLFFGMQQCSNQSPYAATGISFADGGAGAISILNIVITAGVIILVGWYLIKSYGEAAERDRTEKRLNQEAKARSASSAHRGQEATRSDWERKVAQIVRDEASSYDVATNDRSIIPGKYGGENLEIDVYIPALRLGFEANGEHWHDHAGYRRDVQNGTQGTTERYKEVWCQDHGYKLVHLWDSQSDTEIRNVVRSAIRDKRGY